LGADKSRYRANDDGEPSNSAGSPILGQIQSFDLTNILVGVVRYYGGTKLGVGGLINAYKTAAHHVLEHAKIAEKEVTITFHVLFSYIDMPFIMNELKNMDITIIEQHFETDCNLKIAVPLPRVEEFKFKLTTFSTLHLTETI
jgi:putative IMPACT (imprinted ancient) family translation regulator